MKTFLLAAAAISLALPCSAKPDTPKMSLVPMPSGGITYCGQGAQAGPAQISIDPTLAREEYLLSTEGGSIEIKAGSEEGAFRAEQTLRQLLAQCPDGPVPGLKIQDKPKYGWRGAHLDCCRHFFSVDEVKRFIDLMALHKLNVFHWHLTDDQGWRAEIRKYPLLTRIGAFRGENHYGSFYTQDDMREIVRYAAERYITVVPEIEMPGHARAALAAYPELGCRKQALPVAGTWGVFEDVFCIGNPSTLQFLEDVLDEICEIFPGEYIHIGGDEAPRDRWKECPDCQALMKAEGLTTEAGLQSWLVHKIEHHLAAKGRKIIGWDEILEGGVSRNATVMSWQGQAGGIKAAKLGNDVLMAPYTHCYLDYYQTENPAALEPEGTPYPTCLTLRQCYALDPVKGLNKEQATHVIGVQGNTWTEFIPEFSHLEHMVLPRLAAIAETAWNPDGRTSYEDFLQRLTDGLLPIYEEEGYNYAIYAFTATERAEACEPASSGRFHYSGRTLKSGGEVSYDWSGVCANVRFRGTKLKLQCGIEGKVRFNVWIDKTPDAQEDFSLKFDASVKDTTLLIADRLHIGRHNVIIQKCTEGEQGFVTLRHFFTDGEFLQWEDVPSRRIEFIGDSYTAGYGTRSKSKDEGFSVDTEDCNLSYAAIAGRLFDAEISLVCHSGRGLVRNYGGFQAPTMTERYSQVFDEHADTAYQPEGWKPDMVVIYLGTNDFSCGEHPTAKKWCAEYARLLSKIRQNYGSAVPVLCVAPMADPELENYVKMAVEQFKDPNVHWTAVHPKAYNDESDLGASCHPNYQGQRKTACDMVGYISTLTGWELPQKPLL